MRRSPLNAGWSVRPKVNAFLELQGQSKPWEGVHLPHDAQIGTPRSADAPAGNGFFPAGVWEYRYMLHVDEARPVGRVVLDFEGVYRDAVVTVNNSVVAQRPSGYAEFTVRIDHLLKAGENEIRVAARTYDDSRWYTGAGIYRNVWLLESGHVFLVPNGIAVETPQVDDELAIVTVAAEITNDTPSRVDARLRVELIDADDVVVASASDPLTLPPSNDTTARQRLQVRDPKRWNPQTPHLYRAHVTLLTDEDVLDEDSTNFGIRTLSVDPIHGLRINGTPVVLRGACVHHDNGPIGAATLDSAEYRRVALLKQAGFNAIRSAHNPMSRGMLEACDRLGVLVMDESFDMWSSPKTEHDYSLSFEQWWRADIESMVRKDRNHPSVVLYSIGNEIPEGSTPEGLRHARELAEHVRSLDATRFVTQGVSGHLAAGSAVIDEVRRLIAESTLTSETGVNTIALNLGDLMGQVMKSQLIDDVTAEAFSILDVAGYNYMDTRFAIDAARYPNRVIVSTESYGPSIDTEWAAVMDLPQVIGEFTWTGWDYMGEAGAGRIEYSDTADGAGTSTFLGAYPYLTANCGDIDITGLRRAQSYYREIVYGLRREPYIAVQPPQNFGHAISHSGPWTFGDQLGSWTWPGYEGRPVRVEVYTDADEVELLLNDRSLGHQPAGAKNRYRCEFVLDYEPGQLDAVAWRDGQPAERYTLRSATGDVSLALAADRSTLSLSIGDAAFIEVTLADAAGTIFASPDVDRSIELEISGPGVLQGFASANPLTEENFTDSTARTFYGRALAVVRATDAGEISVSARAEGCPLVALTLQASTDDAEGLLHG
jgi:beta-galactosidase